MDRELRERRGLGQRLGQPAAFLDRGGGLVSASRRTAFARVPGDRERVEKRHTVGQQGAERPREARRVDLDQQAAEERHA